MLVLEARHMLNPEPQFSFGPGIFPLRSIHVQIDKNDFNNFESQMRKFAATLAFEDKSKLSSPDPYDVFFIFRRSVIDVLGTNDG